MHRTRLKPHADLDRYWRRRCMAVEYVKYCKKIGHDLQGKTLVKKADEIRVPPVPTKPQQCVNIWFEIDLLLQANLSFSASAESSKKRSKRRSSWRWELVDEVLSSSSFSLATLLHCSRPIRTLVPWSMTSSARYKRISECLWLESKLLWPVLKSCPYAWGGHYLSVGKKSSKEQFLYARVGEYMKQFALWSEQVRGGQGLS